VKQRILAVCAMALAVGNLLAQATEKSKPQPDSQKAVSATREARKLAPDEDGQEVFNRNCSRCHNAPEGFSPSISGTVAHHMRVRANLSDKEYKALLSFLNP
jgi:cytochrome c5